MTLRPSCRPSLPPGAPGIFVAALLFIVLLPDPVWAQCSLCRDAVASSPPAVREAMNYAIIGLALTPYGVAALAAWVLSPWVRREALSRLGKLTVRRRGR